MIILCVYTLYGARIFILYIQNISDSSNSVKYSSVFVDFEEVGSNISMRFQTCCMDIIAIEIVCVKKIVFV